jgi:hypothetical protein
MRYFAELPYQHSTTRGSEFPIPTAMEDTNHIDPTCVLSWTGRSRRQTRPTKRYWDEYVATDKWYQRELVRDIPADEHYAALEDEELDDTEILSEEEDADHETNDSDHNDDEESDDFVDVGEESLHGSSEGESSSEGSDGESESGSVGEERPDAN